MIIVAHRMPADARVAAALVRAGAGMFELDVRLPAGGPAVVTHLRPFGPESARLYHDGWQVRRLAAGGRLGPALGAALALLPAGCEVVLDLKGPIADPAEAGRLLLAELAEPARTHLCGNAGPVAPAASAAGVRIWRSIGSPAELAGALLPAAAVPWAYTVRHTMLTPPVLAALGQRAPRVLAWTVNSVGRALQLRALGVAGITTDRPSVMTALRGADS